MFFMWKVVLYMENMAVKCGFHCCSFQMSALYKMVCILIVFRDIIRGFL